MDTLAFKRSLSNMLRRFLIAATAALASSCPHPLVAQAHSPLQQDLAHALSLYEQDRTEEAEQAFQKILSRNPENETANETLGLIYAQQGAIERALPYLVRAAHAPSSPAVDHANLGTALLKLGRYSGALPELKTAAELDPQNADTASALGQVYMLNHDPKHAATAFAAAAGIGNPSADLLYNWALALSEAGQAQQAASVLARIPAPEMSAEAESLAGELQEKLGHSLAAVKHYQAAAAKDGSEANLYALAVEFLRHWTWTEAQKVAEFGRSQYPASRRMKLALGIAYYGGAQYSRSAAVFADLLDEDPENATYAELLGRTCNSINEGQNASCAQLVSFAERHPGNAIASVYAAEHILHQPAGEQALSQAERLLKSAIATNRKLPDAYYQLGILDQQRLHWQASAAALETAIALRPTFASAHYRLARAYAHMGEAGKAKNEIALQRKYSQQETAQLDANLKALSIFLPAPDTGANKTP